MSEPVFVTLDSIHKDYVAITAELLKTYFAQPKSHTHLWGKEIISARYTIAQYEASGPEILASNMKKDIENAMSNIFGEIPNITINVEEEEGGYYSLSIDIQGRYKEQVFVLNKSVTVDNRGYIVYDTSQDHQTLDDIFA